MKKEYICFDEYGNVQLPGSLTLPDMVVHTSFAVTDEGFLAAIGKTTDTLYIRIFSTRQSHK